MKLFLILTFIFVMVLAGCKNDDVDSNRNIYNINEKSNAIKDDVKSSLNGNIVNNVSGSSDIVENNSIDMYNSDENSVYKNPNELSNFSTKILTDDNNRYNNICIVSDRLNNFVLNPRRNFFF